MPELRSAARAEQARQLLKRFAGKEVAVTARHLSKLLDDRRVDLAVTVTDAERGGAARTVQILPAIGVIDVAPCASHDARQRLHPPANGAICTHLKRGGDRPMISIAIAATTNGPLNK